MTKLMIVESPAKCKTIEGYLGDDWIVKASFGHIRDLPKKEMGVSFPDYRPHYVNSPGSAKTISTLKRLSKQATITYLASDPDREGESISWHVKEALGLQNYKRISFNEITKKALLASLERAGDIDFNLVKAQEARRVLDRLIGYSVSPVISDINGTFISAGRVQSVAVLVVVEREVSIRDFKSNPYFEVELIFEGTDNAWTANWISADFLNTDQGYMQDETLVRGVAAIRHLDVSSYDISQQQRKAPAPFITSTLQQAASSSLKLSPKRCMELAQKLKDEGLITYHRTDNPNISDDGFNAIVSWLDMNGFAGDRVDTVNTFKAKAGAQEGHEAIRPVSIDKLPKEIYVSHDKSSADLYSLIWYRAVCSQMKPASYSVTSVILQSVEMIGGKFARFKAQSRLLIFEGFLKLKNKNIIVQLDTEEVINQSLPKLTVEQKVTAVDSRVLSKKTKPPKRFTEASLIKKLEDEGVGRPSTYASILDNIVKRDYVSIKKRMLFANELGFTIYKLLKDNFSFMNLSYTREIEASLNDLAMGKKQYRAVIDDIYQQLSKELEQLSDISMKNQVFHLCPVCDSNLRHIKNKKFNFWGCSNHPDCSYTAQDNNGKPDDTKSQSNKAKPTDTDIQCPLCHTGNLVERVTSKGKNKGKHFYNCNKTDCDYFGWVKS